MIHKGFFTQNMEQFDCLYLSMNLHSNKKQQQLETCKADRAASIVYN